MWRASKPTPVADQTSHRGEVAQAVQKTRRDACSYLPQRGAIILAVFLLLGTVPVLGQDYDGDGMPDGYERARWCLNWQVPDGHVDIDRDGLSSLTEYQVVGTEPCYSDTDQDGMPDGWEYEHKPCVEPLRFDPPSADYDGDCLPLYYEYANGLELCGAEPDVDGDGMPNCWEASRWCLDRYTKDADANPDGDGADNFSEYIYGKNPCYPDVPSCDDGDECTIDTWFRVCVHIPIMCIDCNGPCWSDCLECIKGICWPVKEFCGHRGDCKYRFCDPATGVCRAVELCPPECCVDGACVEGPFCRSRHQVGGWVIDMLEVFRNGFVNEGLLNLFTASPGLAYGNYDMPAEAAILGLEYQLVESVEGETASLTFGDELLWRADEATPPGEWVQDFVYVGHVAGRTEHIVFALTPGDQPAPNDTLRVRNVRVFNHGTVLCTGEEDFWTTCEDVNGENVFTATVANATPASEVRFQMDDGAPRARTVRPDGSAEAAWRGVPPGEHYASVEFECGDVFVAPLIECPDQPCTGRERLAASCANVNGSNQVKAAVRGGVPGETVDFFLDGGRRHARAFKANGRAVVRWTAVAPGPHEVRATLPCDKELVTQTTCP